MVLAILATTSKADQKLLTIKVLASKVRAVINFNGEERELWRFVRHAIDNPQPVSSTPSIPQAKQPTPQASSTANIQHVMQPADQPPTSVQPQHSNHQQLLTDASSNVDEIPDVSRDTKRLREDASNDPGSVFKTKPCMYFGYGGGCRYHRCPFIHDEAVALFNREAKKK